MAKWIVTVVETVTKYVEVEADNREDAIEIFTVILLTRQRQLMPRKYHETIKQRTL